MIDRLCRSYFSYEDISPLANIVKKLDIFFIFVSILYQYGHIFIEKLTPDPITK